MALKQRVYVGENLIHSTRRFTQRHNTLEIHFLHKWLENSQRLCEISLILIQRLYHAAFVEICNALFAARIEIAGD